MGGGKQLENCSEHFREVHQLSCQGWSGLARDAASPPPSQHPCFRHMAGSASPSLAPSCLRSAAAASRASPSRRPSSDRAGGLRSGWTAQPAKAAAEAAGTRRQQEAAGRRHPCVCRNSFCGCLTFRQQNMGAGTGREPLGAAHPHRAPCSVSKKHFLPLTGKAVRCLLQRQPAWQPLASIPGGCEEVDTHLEQVAPRLHFALSPCAGHPHVPESGAGSPGPSTPRPPSQRHPLPLSSGRTSHTLGAGSCAERREGGRQRWWWGGNLGVSHNAPLQTA